MTNIKQKPSADEIKTAIAHLKANQKLLLSPDESLPAKSQMSAKIEAQRLSQVIQFLEELLK